MKYMMWISLFLSSFFIFLMGHKYYEYLYVPELPWREGDFEAIIARCVLLAAVFATIGIGIWVWIRIDDKRETKNGRNQTGV